MIKDDLPTLFAGKTPFQSDFYRKPILSPPVANLGRTQPGSKLLNSFCLFDSKIPKANKVNGINSKGYHLLLKDGVGFKFIVFHEHNFRVNISF